MSATVLDLKGVSVLRAGAPAVSDLDLTVSAGEIVALLGLNGAGKSSLLRGIMGLEPVSAGIIQFRERDIAALSTAERARTGIGYCPEGRRLFPGMTVSDTLHAASGAPTAERVKRIAELIRLFPLLDHILEQESWSLSGGQQQIVAIARALMGRPEILLLDEPSLGLAPVICRDLFPAIRHLADRGGAILLAEQSLSQALAVADRIAVMHRGKLVLAAPAPEVSHDRLKRLMLSEGEPG
ncbi:ABC transporter ATP-binding protein [Nisaea acidiphila]|uniref:ABC transporter ATP-binding protein n=1 Tax=Nisaea acidiphila TaxID=1862145 RepID=A0A9J7AUI3_9PROT|nr:ABC transporter ATP-binding protein [Nisaea acidiphila]UUX50774.1 ABC transporter ATP-binding protein [Nisaea acidiphila]